MSKNYNYRNPIDIAEALNVAKLKMIKEDKPTEKPSNAESPDQKDEHLPENPNKDEDGYELFDEPPKNPNKKYFFKTIIMFTNERDPEKNKTLKKFQLAVDGTDVDIIPFVADEISYKLKDGKISFSDSKNSLTITDQSNVDTIVITRLGAQNSNSCVELIKELQQWGFFVLNPIEAAMTASNKFETSVLLDKYNIPQPKFALLVKKDIDKGMESLSKKLKLIYDDFGDNPEKDEKKQFVIKILDGHGGTGVFMESGKTILATLQAMFAVKNDISLLLQRKEEADGGDIRVHVLTLRTKQYIIAQMKRKKLGKDFRSNVSLGAKAEPIELTKEQKKIARDVAKISGMPWCAVDIMPLVHNSNKELGDNAVLEYNASPGTDGISAVIGKNFAKILLDTINDVNELVLEPKAIGYREFMQFKFTDNKDERYVKMEAKFDTGNGAKASTIGCDSVNVVGNKVHAVIKGKEYTFDKVGESTPIVGQVEEVRQVVRIPEIKIGSRKLLNAEFSLVDNRDKITPVLINRDIMRKMGYLINPNKKYTLDAK